MPNKVLQKKNQTRKDLKKGLKGDYIKSQRTRKEERLEIPPEVGEVSLNRYSNDSFRDTDNKRFYKSHKGKYKPIDINEYAGDAVEDDLNEEDTDSPAV